MNSNSQHQKVDAVVVGIRRGGGLRIVIGSEFAVPTFDGLGALLDRLDDASRVWGVVTNKPAHLTEAILEKLALAERSVCTISGDTLATRKPDPAQLLHACKLAGVTTDECIYIGDAERDIEAGRRAGIATVAAGYGYVVAEDDPRGWGADEFAAKPDELVQIVLRAVNLYA